MKKKKWKNETKRRIRQCEKKFNEKYRWEERQKVKKKKKCHRRNYLERQICLAREKNITRKHKKKLNKKWSKIQHCIHFVTFRHVINAISCESQGSNFEAFTASGYL